MCWLLRMIRRVVCDPPNFFRFVKKLNFDDIVYASIVCLRPAHLQVSFFRKFSGQVCVMEFLRSILLSLVGDLDSRMLHDTF